MRVLKGSEVLTPLQKLVALEIHGLDNRNKEGGSACYANADTLAERLGTKVDTIEHVRRDLLAYGLLEKKKRFQCADWAVTLPRECWPATERPSPDDLIRHRVALDVLLKPGMSAGTQTRHECRESETVITGIDATPYPAPVPPHTRHSCHPLKEVGVEVGEKDGTPPSTLPGEVGGNRKTQTDKTATPTQTPDGPSTPSDAERWTELRADIDRKLQDSAVEKTSQGYA